MEHWEFFATCIKPLVDSVKQACNADAVYCMGSFLYPDNWELGVSDIDLVLLTQDNRFEKWDEQILLPDQPFTQTVSYVVWNQTVFQDVHSWRRYFDWGQYPETSVIEDQLLFSAANCFVSGRGQLGDIQVPASVYRSYLIARFNGRKVEKKDISLLRELKRIIYACRIYYYLWTDTYVYKTAELIEKSRGVFSEVIHNLLSQAFIERKCLAEDRAFQKITHSTYFARTRRFYFDRMKAVKVLAQQDKKYCENNVDGQFISFY